MITNRFNTLRLRCCRFIKTATSSSIFWEDPTSTSKHSVGSCNPCPGITACANFTVVSNATINALSDGAGFSCGFVCNTSGYTNYFYPSLIDSTSGSLNFDEVGSNASLFLVGNACVGAQGTEGGDIVCVPFTPDGLLVRDILRTTVEFTM